MIALSAKVCLVRFVWRCLEETTGYQSGRGQSLCVAYLLVTQHQLWPNQDTTAREPKRAHLRVAAFKNTTKIQREDSPEREERKKIVAGEGKKRLELLDPHPSGPHPSVPPGGLRPHLPGPQNALTEETLFVLFQVLFVFLLSVPFFFCLVKNDCPCQVQTAMLSTASAQFSAAQQNRVGALVTHHPAWMSYHTGVSRQGHPRYTSAQTVGRPWVARPAGQSAAAHRHRSKSFV